MKKIVLVLLASCTALSGAIAQNVMDIYSTGAPGSYTTGNATSTARVDNTIGVHNIPVARRGYAVFNLNTIPSNAVVTSVELHFNRETVIGGGGPPVYATRGHLGDLSLITAPATLFTTMGIAPQIYSSSYGGGLGNTSLATDPLAVTFIDTNIGRKVSIIWSTTSNRIYTITGQLGAATPSGTHAPFLRVTYNCPDITSMSASGPAVTPCPNTAFTLNGTATGEIASYSWTGPFAFSSTMANPTISGGLPSSGVYTFTVTDTGGCALTATALVSVFPSPATVITPLSATAFCDGDSTTLDASITPGGTYQWLDAGLPIAGATNQTYVAYGSGTYKVAITDANGCSATTPLATTTYLLSNPAVSPVGPMLLCSGDNGMLTVNTNGVTSGLTFQWQKDGVNLPGAVGPTHIAAASGTYRALVSVAASSCVDTSLAVIVDVNSYPVPTVSYSGSTLSTLSTYSSYQWYLNTISIPGATSYAYTPSTPGSYRVRVSDGNGCKAFSAGYPIYTASGVGTLTSSPIRLYPNPVKDIVRIESPFTVNAVISSMEGKVISKHERATEISLSNFPTGLYIISFYNENGERVGVEKITKQ